MSKDKLNGEDIWWFFSSIALHMISQGKEYNGLIIEAKSLHRSYEQLPPDVQLKFDSFAIAYNNNLIEEEKCSSS